MRCFVYSQHTSMAGRIFYYNPNSFDDDDIEYLENSADLIEYTEKDVPFLKSVLATSKNLYDRKAARNVIEFFE